MQEMTDRAEAPRTPKPPQGKRRISNADAACRVLAVLGVAYFLYRRRRDPEVEAICEIGAELEGEAALVLLDIAGAPRPPRLNGRIPDIFALFDDGSELAVEVENDRGVGSSHARAQDKAFSRWASRSSRRHYEQLIVVGGRGGRK